jgi:hypothetical protein
MIPKRGIRFSDQIMPIKRHEPKKRDPIFGQAHAHQKRPATTIG